MGVLLTLLLCLLQQLAPPRGCCRGLQGGRAEDLLDPRQSSASAVPVREPLIGRFAAEEGPASSQNPPMRDPGFPLRGVGGSVSGEEDWCRVRAAMVAEMARYTRCDA